jgi:hypothetical protein
VLLLLLLSLALAAGGHADARAAGGGKASVRAATAKERQALVAALKRGGFPPSDVSVRRPGVSAHPSGYAIARLETRPGVPPADFGNAILVRRHGRWRVLTSGSCCLNHIRGVPAGVLNALLDWAAKTPPE